MLCSCKRAGLSSGFGKQIHLTEAHAPIDRFAHIVDRESGHRGGSQCFHFHTGRSGCLGCRRDRDRAAAFSIRLRFFFEGDIHTREENGMTHGDKVRGLFCPHDPGHLSDRQDVTFCNFAAPDLFESFRLEKNLRLRRCNPLGRILRADIDHPGATRFVEVRKLCHFPR